MRKLEFTIEDVVADLKHVYKEHGKITRRIYTTYGKLNLTVICKRFGTFNSLLELARIPKNLTQSVDKETLTQDIMRVYHQYGELTQELYLREGKYSRKPILRLFSSWNNMLQELGLQLNCLINIPNEQLLDDLKELHEEYGYCSASIIKSCGKYSVEVYQRRFGSVNKAFELAGIPTRERGKAVVAKSVIQSVREILKEIPETEVTFDWLVNDKNGRNLYLDAYFPAHNLVIEYNGIQHYQPCVKWLGEEDVEVYKKRVYRDQLKQNLLKKHGLRLLIIRYDESIDRTSLVKKLATIL